MTCKNGHKDILKYLMPTSSNSLSIRDEDGNTLIHITCLYGQFSCFEYLVQIEQLSPIDLRNNNQQTPLHLACIKGNLAIVEYLLSRKLCKPNTCDCNGLTPMAYALDNVPLIRVLIMYGANPIGAKSFRLVSTLKNPLKNCTSMFVVGDHSAGKTTLVEALKRTKTFKSRLLNISPVISSVPPNTTGICPHEFENKKFGRVVFYDFAGHREFHSSHSVIFSRMKYSSIVILVVDLQNTKSEIENSIFYWCTILENSMTEQDKTIPLIIVGSHADVLESKHENPEEFVHQFKELVLQHGLRIFKLISFIPINCRVPDSSASKQLRKHLQDLCTPSEKLSSLSYNVHCLYLFLLKNFQQDGIVYLQALLQRIRKAVSDESTEWNHELALVLPQTIQHLEEMCEALDEHGHILLLKLPNTKCIVLDKERILHEVNGTIFAPVEFKEHVDLICSTGVVPFHKIRDTFVKWDPQVIIQFLSQMELCHQISDSSILEMIQFQDTYQTIHTTDLPKPLCEPYLFFPSLVQVQAPINIWRTDVTDFPFYFGWTVCTNDSKEFLLPRFQVSLIVRIAFSFALALEPPHTYQDNPSLQRKCSIWKNGIYWGSRSGMEALVEISENCHAVVLMVRTSSISSEFLHMRSSLITLIRETLHEFCPLIAASESFVAPNELKEYPLQPHHNLTLFSVKEVSSAIITGMPAVVSKNGTTVSVNDLLLYEVYSQLPIETLTKLFLSEGSLVNDILLMDISKAFLSMKIEVFALFKEFISQEAQCKNPLHTRDDILAMLNVWRIGTDDKTCKSLRCILDRWSVFAGVGCRIFVSLLCNRELQCTTIFSIDSWPWPSAIVTASPFPSYVPYYALPDCLPYT